VPIGYADGYDRGLSNQFEMYVRGRRCPILGRICMDQTVIGLPSESEVEVGEPVIVAGAWDGGGPPTIDEIACQIGTINYEVAARIAARVPRFFVKDGHVVAVSDLQGHRTIESIPLNSK
jgi:alanine racemase